MKFKIFVLAIIAAFAFAVPCFAENAKSDNENGDNSWPRIGVIDEGTTWEIEVTPAGSDELLTVNQTVEGTEIINGKEYRKLWSSVNGEERKVISYLYIHGQTRSIYAIDPDDPDKNERMIYSFNKSWSKIASIDWKGKMSTEDYFAITEEANVGSFPCVNPNIQPNRSLMKVYSIKDEKKDTYLGDVEWVDGIGNVTGLLNQCYCLDSGDKVILKQVRSKGDGIIYSYDQASVNDIEINEEISITAIYDMNGRVLHDFGPGLNIVKYSDGSVKKIMK